MVSTAQPKETLQQAYGKNRVQTASMKKTFCFLARSTRIWACFLLTVRAFSQRTIGGQRDERGKRCELMPHHGDARS
jgi:hypothetical protein